MAEVLHETAVEPVKPPAGTSEANAEIELLVAVQVAVREVADVLDGTAPVEPAAVHAIDRTRPVLRRIAADAAREFEVRDVHFLHMSGNARHGRIVGQEADGVLEEGSVEQHVAVDETDVIVAGMLEAELRTDAAARSRGRGDLGDDDGILRGDLDRAVAGAAVGDDDLAAHVLKRCERALDGCGNPLLFIQCLDDDGYGQRAPESRGEDLSAWFALWFMPAIFGWNRYLRRTSSQPAPDAAAGPRHFDREVDQPCMAVGGKHLREFQPDCSREHSRQNGETRAGDRRSRT